MALRDYHAIAAYLEQHQWTALADRVKDFIGRVQPQQYFDGTKANYNQIKDTVIGHGLTLVSIQYPMRSVEPLKSLLDFDRRVRFVDNEQIFKEAVGRSRYEDYFSDNFAGDFGHCTPKGNRLLAENIARVVTSP